MFFNAMNLEFLPSPERKCLTWGEVEENLIFWITMHGVDMLLFDGQSRAKAGIKQMTGHSCVSQSARKFLQKCPARRYHFEAWIKSADETHIVSVSRGIPP